MSDVVPIPRRERVVASLVGKALLWLGKRAHDRGDTHQYEHALAALLAGRCEACDPSTPGGVS